MYDVDALRERLRTFGYEAKAGDGAALSFCLEKVRGTVKNETNCQDVPEGLERVAVDMACGEFLNAKKTFAPDDLGDFDLNYAVKQIQTGDTNTVFAVGEGCPTHEQRLTAFIGHLMGYGKSEFHSFRKVRW